MGSDTRKQNDLFELIKSMPAGRESSLPYFYFDCGTDDAPHTFNVNHELSELMAHRKIQHQYRELPGNHSWAYWDQQIQQVLDVLAQKVRLPKPARN
jgi:putative tributyrin esterase